MNDFSLVRYAMFLAQADGNTGLALAQAMKYYGPNSNVVAMIQRTSSGTQDIGTDAAFRSLGGDPFLEMVARRSLLGKINAISRFRKAAPNVSFLAQTARPVASWTGEGENVYATKNTFQPHKLSRLKIAALVVNTEELLSGLGPTFESAVANDLVVPIAHLESDSLFNPSNEGIPEKSPASLTYGLSELSGTSSPREDIQTLVENFQGDLDTAVLVMDPTIAVIAGGYFNDSLGARGGECAGIPTLTSSSLESDSDGHLITLVDPSGIAMLDEGVDIRTSTAASIKISDEEGMYSLFQNSLKGMIATRYLNWETVRPGSVLSMRVGWSV